MCTELRLWLQTGSGCHSVDLWMLRWLLRGRVGFVMQAVTSCDGVHMVDYQMWSDLNNLILNIHRGWKSEQQMLLSHLMKEFAGERCFIKKCTPTSYKVWNLIDAVQRMSQAELVKTSRNIILLDHPAALGSKDPWGLSLQTKVLDPRAAGGYIWA